MLPFYVGLIIAASSCQVLAFNICQRSEPCIQTSPWPDERDCTVRWECSNGKWKKIKCPQGEQYDFRKLSCQPTAAGAVSCQDGCDYSVISLSKSGGPRTVKPSASISPVSPINLQATPAPASTKQMPQPTIAPTRSTTAANTATPEPQDRVPLPTITSQPCNDSLREECPQDSVPGTIRRAVLGNCGSYEKCQFGVWQPNNCPPSMHFDTISGKCKLKKNSSCFTTCNQFDKRTRSADEQCPRLQCEEQDIRPDGRNCNRFYRCISTNRWKRFQCREAHWFDAIQMRCVFQSKNNCFNDNVCKKVCLEVEEGDSCAPGSRPVASLQSCKEFYKCSSKKWKVNRCKAAESFDVESGKCINTGTAVCFNGSNCAEEQRSTDYCSQLPPNTCEDEGDSWPDKNDCSVYWTCRNRVFQQGTCNAGEKFDKTKLLCIASNNSSICLNCSSALSPLTSPITDPPDSSSPRIQTDTEPPVESSSSAKSSQPLLTPPPSRLSSIPPVSSDSSTMTTSVTTLKILTSKPSETTKITSTTLTPGAITTETPRVPLTTPSVLPIARSTTILPVSTETLSTTTTASTSSAQTLKTTTSSPMSTQTPVTIKPTVTTLVPKIDPGSSKTTEMIIKISPTLPPPATAHPVGLRRNCPATDGWPKTEIEFVVKLQCPGSYQGWLFRKCKRSFSGAEWDEVIDGCIDSSISEIWEKITEQPRLPIVPPVSPPIGPPTTPSGQSGPTEPTGPAVEMVLLAEKLKMVTANEAKLNVGNVNASLQCLFVMSSHSSKMNDKKEKIIYQSSMLEVGSNLLRSDNSVWHQIDSAAGHDPIHRQMNSAVNLMKIIGDVGNDLAETLVKESSAASGCISADYSELEFKMMSFGLNGNKKKDGTCEKLPVGSLPNDGSSTGSSRAKPSNGSPGAPGIGRTSHSIPVTSPPQSKSTIDHPVKLDPKFEFEEKSAGKIFVGGGNVHLPKETVKAILNKTGKEDLALWTLSYQGLDDIITTVDKNETIISKVLSISVLELKPEQEFRPGFMFTLEHLNATTAGHHVKCAFWNFTKHKRRGGWSTDGCTSLRNTENETTCECYHMTNFAILMSKNPLIGDHKFILDMVSLVCILLSILGLFATIVVHVMLWNKVQSHHAAVLLCLCACLIAALATFLLGIQQSGPACQYIAIGLHYLFLVAFMIMLVDGIQFLFYVVYVFHVRRKRETLILLLLAWVIPLFIVGTMVYRSYPTLQGYGTDKYCWIDLSNQELMLSLVLPLAVVILVNFVVLMIVLKTVSASKAAERRSRIQRVRASIWNIAVILPLLGICWSLGFLLISDTTSNIIVQYLFSILNGLQGFLIFIFHCLLNKKIKDAFKEKFNFSSSDRSSSNLPGKMDYHKVGGRKCSKSTNSTGLKRRIGKTSSKLSSGSGNSSKFSPALPLPPIPDDIPEHNSIIIMPNLPSPVTENLTPITSMEEWLPEGERGKADGQETDEDTYMEPTSMTFAPSKTARAWGGKNTAGLAIRVGTHNASPLTEEDFPFPSPPTPISNEEYKLTRMDGGFDNMAYVPASSCLKSEIDCGTAASFFGANGSVPTHRLSMIEAPPAFRSYNEHQQSLPYFEDIEPFPRCHVPTAVADAYPIELTNSYSPEAFPIRSSASSPQWPPPPPPILSDQSFNVQLMEPPPQFIYAPPIYFQQ